MDNPAGFKRSPLGLYVPERRPRYTLPTCVDLFCGMGGFSLGFIQAGWQVVMGVDNHPEAMHTYLANLGSYPVDIRYTSPQWRKVAEDCFEKAFKAKDRETKKGVPKGRIGPIHAPPVSGAHRPPGQPPVTHFYFGDVRELSGKMVLDALGMERGELDAIIGGPPCQGFSISGKREIMDPRNSLVFDFARLVVEIQPKTMVMENVPGIVSMVTPEGIPVVDAICRILEDGGFGTVDALKRSLLASSGAGAALKGKGDSEKPKKGKQRQPAVVQASFLEG